MEEAKFIPNVPIKVLIHGYTGHVDYAPNPQIRPHYLKKGYNVITVDYKNLVPQGCYTTAVKNAAIVAECCAKFLDTLLHARSDLRLENIHVVGLSLGAHVSGQISKHLKLGELERVTGLDPALPLFFDYFRPEDSMLSKESAKFVDVLHTNAGVKGKYGPLGHVDFYANGGTFQKDCGLDTTCSHERSANYFGESVTTNIGFWAYPCNSLAAFFGKLCKRPKDSDYILYGEYVTYTARGDYFFDTNAESPFAMGKKYNESHFKS